jgi:hypothetical protein
MENLRKSAWFASADDLIWRSGLAFWRVISANSGGGAERIEMGCGIAPERGERRVAHDI